MYDYYISIARPFVPDELTQAIKNVKTAQMMSKHHMSFNEATIESQKILAQRMKKTMKQQIYWDKDDDGFLVVGSKKDNDLAIK